MNFYQLRNQTLCGVVEETFLNGNYGFSCVFNVADNNFAVYSDGDPYDMYSLRDIRYSSHDWRLKC